MTKTKTYTPTISRKEFFKRSKRERRVLIAKDVLLRISTGVVKPVNGDFINVLDVNGYSRIMSSIDVDQKHVNTNPCEACAKGALVCSWFGNLNKHTFTKFSLGTGGISEWDTGTKEIVDTFGKKLWNAIECLFENWNYTELIENAQLTPTYKLKGAANKKAVAEGDAFDAYSEDIYFDAVLEGDENRAVEAMTAIMQNIIKNKGRLLIPGLNKKKGFLIGT